MSFTVDTSGFTRMAKELARMSGTPLKAVILAETGKVLEGCVRRTRVASAESIGKSVAFRNRNLWTDAQWPPKKRGEPILSVTKSGVAWFVDEPGTTRNAGQGRRVGSKTFHPMTENFRWSDARWARYQAAIALLQQKKTDLAAALRSRGLMAHSWVQIADALGVQVNVPGYVRSAQPSNGQVYVNGRALQFETATSFFVEIFNDNPGLARGGGAAILEDAIRGRVNYFETSLRVGVFDSIKKAASRYPGVFVS